MITQIQVRGEAASPERLKQEFDLLERALARVFRNAGSSMSSGHVLVECRSGDPEVSVPGNWKGRCTFHPDTQRLNEQLAQDAVDYGM